MRKGAPTITPKILYVDSLAPRKIQLEIIEHALSLKLGYNQFLEDFVKIAAKAYEAAGVTGEQKFAILSKTALVYEDLQNFIVQRSPITAQEVRDALYCYHLH